MPYIAEEDIGTGVPLIFTGDMKIFWLATYKAHAMCASYLRFNQCPFYVKYFSTDVRDK